MAQSGYDRRKSLRVAVDYAVFYYYVQRYSAPTKMLDMSVEGAGLEALDRLSVDSSVAFIFVMGKVNAVECGGKVVYVNACPDGKYRLGVRFQYLSDEGRGLVAQAVRSGRPTQPQDDSQPVA